MRGMWIIFRREMQSYFVSPVAYSVLMAFLILAGWYFWGLTVSFMQLASSATEQAIMLQQPPPVLNVNMAVIRPWFNIAAELFLFLTPIVTMRLLAEERGTGRIDLLLSAPVTDLSLVMGKYFAGVALCLLFLAPTAIYQAVLFAAGNPQLAPILAGYLGLAVLSAALVAVGLLVSSLTSSQVVAAAGGFGVSVLLSVVGILVRSGDSIWGSLLSGISLLDHFSDFANGVIGTRHLVYFVSFVVLMLFLTLRTVESQRWRG